ncbi:hypothetical protein ABK040_004846 [Willaertia magna]
MTSVKNLTGWNLFNHFQHLSGRKGSYVPPLVFKVMLKVPPPVKYGLAMEPKLKELVFPDDKLKVLLEKKSKHRKFLLKSGFTPLPFWFARNLRASALGRVREIMEKEGLSEEEAITKWDEEYSREIEIQQRECTLLSEAAIKNNQALTLKDTMNVLKLIRDVQKEHDIKQSRKLRKIVAKLEIERRKLLGLEIDQALLDESEVDTVDFERLVNVEKVKRQQVKVENRVNQTLLRKIAQAIEVERIAIRVRDMKALFGNETCTYSEGEHISPYDFIAAYIKAYDINKVGATSAEWGKDKETYRGYEFGMNGYETIKELLDDFKEMFNRFKRLTVVDGDMHAILSELQIVNGIKTEEDSQLPKSTLEALASQLGVEKIDLTPVVDALQSFHWRDWQKLKSDQAVIESFFLYLELGCYIYNMNVVRSHGPMYAIAEDVDLKRFVDNVIAK